MAISHRRQAEGLIAARVLLVADANQRLLEQLDDCGDDFSARERGAREVGPRPSTQHRQRRRELENVAVLGFVADFAPPRVVAMLFRPLASRPVAWR